MTADEAERNRQVESDAVKKLIRALTQMAKDAEIHAIEIRVVKRQHGNDFLTPIIKMEFR